MKIRLKVCETYEDGYDDGPVLRAITVIPETERNKLLLKNWIEYVKKGKLLSDVDAVEFSAHNFEYMVFDALVEHIAYDDFTDQDFESLYGVDRSISNMWNDLDKCIVDSTMEEISNKLKVLGFKKLDVYPTIRISAYGRRSNEPLQIFTFLFDIVDDEGFDHVDFKDLNLSLVDMKSEV
jgi:hypothetical protein